MDTLAIESYPVNEKGRRICGAKKRGKGGEVCRAIAVMENGRCRIHGGKTPKGIAASRYKHGLYSAYMPARLIPSAMEAANDPELLSVRADIGLVYGRITDLLKRVDTGETGMLWEQAKSAFAEYKATRGGAREIEFLLKLEAAIEKGLDDYAAWEQISQLLEQRRKLVESERKRLVEAEQMITAERAMLLIGALAGILKRRVTDPKLLADISEDIGTIIGRSVPVPAERSG